MAGEKEPGPAEPGVQHRAAGGCLWTLVGSQPLRPGTPASPTPLPAPLCRGCSQQRGALGQHVLPKIW